MPFQSSGLLACCEVAMVATPFGSAYFTQLPFACVAYCQHPTSISPLPIDTLTYIIWQKSKLHVQKLKEQVKN